MPCVESQHTNGRVAVGVSYRVERFKAEHLRELEIQLAQRTERQVLMDWADTPEGKHWNQIEEHCGELSFTGYCGDRLLGCAGLRPCWANRGELWIMLSATMRRSDMVWLHRQAKAFLEEHQLPTIANSRPIYPYDFTRIECYVLENFVEGHRWAKMLGFESEGLLRCFDPLGYDYRLYARIRR